jgi:DNA-binding NtrC family response regulator
MIRWTEARARNDIRLVEPASRAAVHSCSRGVAPQQLRMNATMKALEDKPLIVFTWLGNVDRYVAIGHQQAAGLLASADANRLRKPIHVADNRYSRSVDGSGLGFGKIKPLADFLGQAVEYHVLSDHEAESTDHFRDWLQGFGYTVVMHRVPLTSASDYGEVYDKVDALLAEFEKTHPQTDYDYGFYLAPGTRAMSSVWLLLARTRFNGNVYHWGTKDSRPSLVQLPFDLDVRFLPAVDARRTAALAVLRDSFPDEALADISGNSPAILSAKQTAADYAALPFDVLLIGDTGTGKDKFARCIHKASLREAKPFIPVNCGEFTDALFSSRMFGHRKGSFTDASKDQPGLMKAAHGGTLFLDEVGELSLAMQASLLRALQPRDDAKPTIRHIRPVGSDEDEIVNVRIIAATNRNLVEMVKRGEFREDLLQRLDYLTIRIPTLMERKDDIPDLIKQFLGDINASCRDADSRAQPKSLVPKAIRVLQAAHWSGNVRQLKKVLARAHAFAAGADITAEDVTRALRNDAFGAPERTPILDRPLGNGFDLGEVELELRAHYLRRAIAEGGDAAKGARLIGYPPDGEKFRQHLKQCSTK